MSDLQPLFFRQSRLDKPRQVVHETAGRMDIRVVPQPVLHFSRRAGGPGPQDSGKAVLRNGGTAYRLALALCEGAQAGHRRNQPPQGQEGLRSRPLKKTACFHRTKSTSSNKLIINILYFIFY